MAESCSKVMEAIGGYFSLELPLHEEYHKDAIKLNTGRNCLEYILRCKQYKKVYIPYYTCDVILEPFHKLGIEYTFYHINLDFEIADDIFLQKSEAILYTNYYGLKQKYVEILAERYGQKLIVDNTQAFYAKPINGIDTFYTCRKFFGVPDGAYLYTDKLIGEELEQDVSYERMTFLHKRIDLGAESGYSDFQEESQCLVGQPLKIMSRLTERLMRSIDYHRVAIRRRDNFLSLHKELRKKNLLDLKLDREAVPMVYPYLSNKESLRQHLINNKIYVACYWPNVLDWVNPIDLEFNMVTRLSPIPCDQRYIIKDTKLLVSIINNF